MGRHLTGRDAGRFPGPEDERASIGAPRFELGTGLLDAFDARADEAVAES
jgi:hypothetical protein